MNPAKPFKPLLPLLLIAALWGCASQSPTEAHLVQAPTEAVPQESPQKLSPPPTVNPFTLDELFDQGAGGCGMSLLQPGAPRGEGFLFSHGLGEEPALMKINGEWVWLQRTAASGEEFYGQATSQTFSNQAADLIVETDVTLGAAGEIESVEFSDAVLRVTHDGQTVEIQVEGDAGC